MERYFNISIPSSCRDNYIPTDLSAQMIIIQYHGQNSGR